MVHILFAVSSCAKIKATHNRLHPQISPCHLLLEETFENWAVTYVHPGLLNINGADEFCIFVYHCEQGQGTTIRGLSQQLNTLPEHFGGLVCNC